VDPVQRKALGALLCLFLIVPVFVLLNDLGEGDWGGAVLAAIWAGVVILRLFGVFGSKSLAVTRGEATSSYMCNPTRRNT
jgi:hypothetical protein